MHVRYFFEELCEAETQRDVIKFVRSEGLLTVPAALDGKDLRQAVDLLYDVRCDVTHRGEFRSLWYVPPPDALSEKDIIATIRHHERVLQSYGEFRACVIRGVISTLNRCIDLALQSESRNGAAGS